MYLVLCFDFEDSSSVTLECMSTNLESANICYQEKLQNEQTTLVELIEVSCLDEQGLGKVGFKIKNI